MSKKVCPVLIFMDYLSNIGYICSQYFKMKYKIVSFELRKRVHVHYLRLKKKKGCCCSSLWEHGTNE